MTNSACVGRVTFATERVHVLGPLEPLEAARLLGARAPGHGDLLHRPGQPPCSPMEDVVASLARHPVMSLLGGNAHAISLAASVLTGRTLDEVRPDWWTGVGVI